VVTAVVAGWLGAPDVNSALTFWRLDRGWLHVTSLVLAYGLTGDDEIV